MQRTPAWVAFGDQAGEHGEEPGQQHCGQDRQQRRRIYLAGVRPEHLGQMLAAFSSLASIGISATPMTQASIPVTAAAVPSGPRPGR